MTKKTRKNIYNTLEVGDTISDKSDPDDGLGTVLKKYSILKKDLDKSDKHLAGRWMLVRFKNGRCDYTEAEVNKSFKKVND